MDGFGEKSCSNLIASIDKARKVKLPALIYALGIPGIGVANAKVLARAFYQDLDKLRAATAEELTAVDGIGDVMAQAVCDYFNDSEKMKQLDSLLKELELVLEENNEKQYLENLTFVITGSVHHFANRSELKNYIEKHGGKAAGSVSAKTSYLINNDKESTSSKTKRQRSLVFLSFQKRIFLICAKKWKLASNVKNVFNNMKRE